MIRNREYYEKRRLEDLKAQRETTFHCEMALRYKKLYETAIKTNHKLIAKWAKKKNRKHIVVGERIGITSLKRMEKDLNELEKHLNEKEDS